MAIFREQALLSPKASLLGRIQKRAVGSSFHVFVTFSDQTGPKANSFGPRGHQMKNYSFSRRWLIINNFFDMRDTEMKMTPS